MSDPEYLRAAHEISMGNDSAPAKDERATAEAVERVLGMSCEDQCAIATTIATNLGMVLVNEPPHPDSPHNRTALTEEMVERGARAMCSSKGYPPDEIFHAQGETPMRMWQFFKEDARAVLAAAGGGK